VEILGAHASAIVRCLLGYAIWVLYLPQSYYQLLIADNHGDRPGARLPAPPPTPPSTRDRTSRLLIY
jgi:hypothetical protein